MNLPNPRLRSRSAFASAISIIYSLLIVACATTPALTPITDINQRMDFKGVSVIPPQGKDWYWKAPPVGAPTGGIVAFYKKVGEWTEWHTGVAGVRLYNVGNKHFKSAEDLGSMVDRNFRKSHKKSKRFTLIESTYTVDRSYDAMCVRFRQAQEDRGVPGRVGEPFTIDAHGIYCVHPYSKWRIVEISYSERRPKDTASWSLEGEIEPFLKRLKFSPL